MTTHPLSSTAKDCLIPCLMLLTVILLLVPARPSSAQDSPGSQQNEEIVRALTTELESCTENLVDANNDALVRVGERNEARKATAKCQAHALTLAQRIAVLEQQEADRTRPVVWVGVGAVGATAVWVAVLLIAR